MHKETMLTRSSLRKGACACPCVYSSLCCPLLYTKTRLAFSWSPCRAPHSTIPSISIHAPSLALSSAQLRRHACPVPLSVARTGSVSLQAAAGYPRSQYDKDTNTPANQAAHKTAFFTGSYAVAFGLALTIAPKTIFGLLFRSETVSSGWIRVGGILFTLIGWQYLGTALGDRKDQGARGFYSASVWSRLALAAAFVLLVAAGQSPPGLLLLAALNVAGAGAMYHALRGGRGTDDGTPNTLNEEGEQADEG
ncbi:hypothetical protein Agub_g5642, partial [Astrephomene gubernaculifera]